MQGQIQDIMTQIKGSKIPTTIENLLLAALPPDEYNRLAPSLELVELSYGKRIYDFGDTIHEVYFPNSGMSALLSITQDGEMIEVGVVGNEGMFGIPIILGVKKTSYQVIVQAEGTAIKMGAGALKQEFNQHGSLRDLLLRYLYTLVTQLSQSVVCNRFHTVEARLCRSLLVTSDRVKSSEFRLTQEFLSLMLGSRRQGISEAASSIQRAGIISYARGRITILDREALESISCECYGVVKEAYGQALGL